MEITANISKISKTLQRGRTFISDVLSESLFGFASYLVSRLKKILLVLQKKCFYRERGSVTMRNYAETFLDNHDYNMV